MDVVLVNQHVVRMHWSFSDVLCDSLSPFCHFCFWFLKMTSASCGLFFPTCDPFDLCGVIDWSPENEAQETRAQCCVFFHPAGLLHGRLFFNRANKNFPGELSSMKMEDLKSLISSHHICWRQQ